jgi:hypothetical protein
METPAPWRPLSRNRKAGVRNTCEIGSSTVAQLRQLGFTVSSHILRSVMFFLLPVWFIMPDHRQKFDVCDWRDRSESSAVSVCESEHGHFGEVTQSGSRKTFSRVGDDLAMTQVIDRNVSHALPNPRLVAQCSSCTILHRKTREGKGWASRTGQTSCLRASHPAFEQSKK